MFSRDCCVGDLLPGVLAFWSFPPLIFLCIATSLLALTSVVSQVTQWNIIDHCFVLFSQLHVLHVFFPIYFYLLLWSHPVRIVDMHCKSACSCWGNCCNVPSFTQNTTGISSWGVWTHFEIFENISDQIFPIRFQVFGIY